MGVRISEITSEYASELGVQGGIFVSSVYRDSPAMDAGLEPGDLITLLNEESVQELSKFRLKIASFRPGEVVLLRVLRDGVPINMKVTLGAL